MTYKVAVVGASGNVGREMLNVLTEREFPVSEVYALASARSAGKEVSFGDQTIKIQDLEKFSFKGVDIVLASAGSKVSEAFAPGAAKSDAVVIDNSSFFRMDKDVPLVVPEVNAQAIAGYKKKGIIANPNCSTIQMVVALKPLHDIAKIKRIVVATYQSVSGAGKEGMDELFNQTRALYSATTGVARDVFAKQIAFNVIPQIDAFMEDGYTKEEWKMRVETRKILGPDIEVTATCVRVPVFVGHSEAVNVEFHEPITVAQARKALQKAPGVVLIDKPDPEEGFATPIEIAGDDPVYVSRVRKDETVKHGLSLWVVADNLRKGAATNAVQIAEILAKEYL